MQQRPEWQLAAEMLLPTTTLGVIVMMAQIAVLKALNAAKPTPEPRRKRERANKMIR
jgi:hypothetical protein